MWTKNPAALDDWIREIHGEAQPIPVEARAGRRTSPLGFPEKPCVPTENASGIPPEGPGANAEVPACGRSITRRFSIDPGRFPRNLAGLFHSPQQPVGEAVVASRGSLRGQRGNRAGLSRNPPQQRGIPADLTSNPAGLSEKFQTLPRESRELVALPSVTGSRISCGFPRKSAQPAQKSRGVVESPRGAPRKCDGVDANPVGEANASSERIQ